jgi:hypothetical protein
MLERAGVEPSPARLASTVKHRFWPRPTKRKMLIDFTTP